MLIRKKGSAAWQGGLKDGKGTVSTESGVLKGAQYGFNTRFENGPGTMSRQAASGAYELVIRF